MNKKLISGTAALVLLVLGIVVFAAAANKPTAEAKNCCAAKLPRQCQRLLRRRRAARLLRNRNEVLRREPRLLRGGAEVLHRGLEVLRRDESLLRRGESLLRRQGQGEELAAGHALGA